MSSTEQSTIVGTPGAADVKAIVKYIAHIVSTSLDVKPSECILKNYDLITRNAIGNLLKLFPELTNEINALAGKFAEIQEASKKLVGVKDVGEYADNVISIFATYNVDPGIYALFAALQAIEASRACSDADAKFFLVRALLAGSLPNSLYRLLLDYLGMDHKFAVNLLKALLESTR